MEVNKDGYDVQDRMVRDCYDAIQAHDSKRASDLIDYIYHNGLDVNQYVAIYIDEVC